MRSRHSLPLVAFCIHCASHDPQLVGRPAAPLAPTSRPPPPANAGTSEETNVEGARLKGRTEHGFTHYNEPATSTRIFDKEFGTDCYPSVADDGVMRCLPAAYGTGEKTLRFATADCSGAPYLTDEFATKSRYITVSGSVGTRAYKAASVVAPPRLYARDASGACVSDPGPFRVMLSLTLVPAQKWVEGTLDCPRRKTQTFHGVDGSHTLVGYVAAQEDCGRGR